VRIPKGRFRGYTTTEKSSDVDRLNYFNGALGFKFGRPKVETMAA
jgi:hypothetical protein